ncbi:hypothetical protein [Metaclostridioides mangenotii]|uniref:hypothetical protein n=1 Tax=Metaclostridioides mangenotii TaxID=1540 RepID=UPI000467BEA7|nr:hypothetical protein [Clostridioides mangenotii]
MTFEKKYQNLSKNDNNDSEIALQIIKKNLKKRKFETQTQMVSFLKSNGIYISQATLSRILSENNIVKGDAGYMKIL